MSWGLIRLQDQFGLVFTYLDPQAGPSAKGTLLRSTEPTQEDVDAACRRPNVTVRLAPGLSPLPLDAATRARLTLPEAPDWLHFFTPKQRPWHADPHFAGRFHPSYPDDVQVNFFLPASTQVEQMWVRLDGGAAPTWEGTLLNTAHTEPGLAAGTRVKVRGAPGAKAPLWLSPDVEANLSGWSARCDACGFDLVLEPIAGLVAKLFSSAPPGTEFVQFTTRCAMCGQTQHVSRRDAAASPAPPPAKWGLWVALGGAVLGAWVLWQLFAP